MDIVLLILCIKKRENKMQKVKIQRPVESGRGKKKIVD